MVKTSAAKKSQNSQKQTRKKAEDQVKYTCDLCGRVIYMDICGDYRGKDFMCCGESMR
ncbi:MAG TPA: hypothetical protein VHO84_03635 [Syntrophorhabdaceae bacterium]|nr:hypothetical protein [Syntrophorhabdaceae bacterium]